MCACGIEKKWVHAAGDAGSAEEKKKPEGNNETMRKLSSGKEMRTSTV